MAADSADALRKMEKNYAPRAVEEKWQQRWLTEEFYQVYSFKNDGRPIFTIDTPPPFTSGELHMGHAYWNSINDTIARYKRMRGYDVILPQGWDCQGLPTELKVQFKWKVPRNDRKVFREKCAEWTANMIKSMKGTMIRLGYRPDWERLEYRTMDRSYWKAVQGTLLTMFKNGRVYKKEFPVQWCPRCGTALAQAEVGYVQKKGKIYHIKFAAADSGGCVEVATTRPELLNACQALAVNPQDGRYGALVGKEVVVPAFGNRVRILADDAVDREFGTGVVMICTYGDEQDIKWQQTYRLPITRAIDEYGRMENAGKYTGMKAATAREEVVKDLQAEGMVSKVEEITHNVLTHNERADCMAPIEFLVKDQWFIKSKEFREMMLADNAQMKWTPKFMSPRLDDWVNSIEWDWLISRQRVFGTPIPFWYCISCNEIIPPREEDLPVDTSESRPPVDRCPKCGGAEIAGTTDVCDCWVDSSITPLIATGYFTDRERFKRAYPVDLRQQGHDIIRTWMYYTTLRCHLLTGQAPFKGALINGHILGPDGSRMSKSKGNVIDPEQGINEYGADAIRQALLSLTLGSDFPFKWEPVKYGKGFLQKVWSSARFVEGFFGEKSYQLNEGELEDVDRWILYRLDETVSKVTEAMDGYQFHIAVDLLQRFYWHDFCDQYIEAAKPRLYSPRNAESSMAAKATLHKAISTFIRLLAPICPHITEEIYQKVFRDGEGAISVHATSWPKVEGREAADGRAGELVVNAIAALRAKKVGMKAALAAEVKLGRVMGSEEMLMACRKNEWLIRQTLHIADLEFIAGEAGAEIVR